MMNNLEFRQLELNDYQIIWNYMSLYGENSCQHSFVSMYSLHEKYGDAICVSDGFLYVLREHLCNDKERVYLAPMGDGDKKRAVEMLLEDAHMHGARVVFHTITETYRAYLEKEFPNRFSFIEHRNYAEYIYDTQKLSILPGIRFKNRRNDINRFFSEYDDRAHINMIQKDDIKDILVFQEKWLIQNSEDHDKEALYRESRTITLQLEHYDELNLSGIVIRIDGMVYAYGYGTPISNDCYDSLIEKGDRNIPYIYRVLFRESVRHCAMDYRYVNREEDLGVEGLRKAKMAYQPDILLKKYTVTEI